MDIFGTTVVAIGIVGKFLQYARSVNAADTNLKLLFDRTEHLSELLGTLHVNFQTPFVQRMITESQNRHPRGYEGTFWRSIGRSIEDCTELLQKLETTLRNAARGGAGMSRIFRGVRMQFQQGEIVGYLDQIDLYRETIQFAMTWLTL